MVPITGLSEGASARPSSETNAGADWLMSDEDTSGQAFHSDEKTVQLALAAADAIQRLVADRKALRSRLSARDAELARLRQHVVLLRDNYRRLASELVSQLEIVDRIDSEVAKGTDGIVEFPRFLENASLKAGT